MYEELGYAIVVTLIFLALFLSFAIGANDETPSPLAAAGTLKLTQVLIIGGAGLVIGIVFLSESIAEMVGTGIFGKGITPTIFMLLAVLISAIVWLIIGSFAGIPLSSTHSLIGSIVGVVIVYSMFSGGVDVATAFNWDKLGRVIISWFVSPLAGLIVTFLMYKLFAKISLSKNKGLNDIEATERKFSYALMVAVFISCLWTGANSAEALGILYALYDTGQLNLQQYYLFVAICGIFAFFGMFLAGRFVIKNLASQLTDSRPSDGFIITLSGGIILMFCTLIYSVPISHSHVVVFCIFGLSIAQKKEIDAKGLGKMAIFWVLTFPVAALFAGFIYYIFVSFGMV